MKARTIVLGGLVYTIAAFIVTLLVLKPAKPLIGIKGEKLVGIAESSNKMLSFEITNTLFTAWVAMALLILFWFLVTRKKDDVPTGLQNLGEAIIEGIEGFINSIAGPVNGPKFFSLIATLLIYIAFANWLSLSPVFNAIGVFEPVHTEAKEDIQPRVEVYQNGGVSLLMPGSKDFKLDTKACEDLNNDRAIEQCREHAVDEATQGKVKDNEKVGTLAPYLRGINTDLMTPAAFALVAVAMVEWWGITSLGFFKYMGKFINFSSPINFFVGFLETIAEIARLISFSFRLFGNMLAGEILLLVMTFLMGLVSTLVLVFYGLELFVGLIQAFVFAALTLVFATLAVTSHGGDEHEHHAEEVAH